MRPRELVSLPMSPGGSSGGERRLVTSESAPELQLHAWADSLEHLLRLGPSSPLLDVNSKDRDTRDPRALEEILVKEFHEEPGFYEATTEWNVHPQPPIHI